MAMWLWLQEITWKMVWVKVLWLTCILKFKLYFLACLNKILSNTEYVLIKSMSKLEMEATENTETITAQLSLFKFLFIYEQSYLIISAKFVFYCRQQNKTNLSSWFSHSCVLLEVLLSFQQVRISVHIRTVFFFFFFFLAAKSHTFVSWKETRNKLCTIAYGCGSTIVL